MVSDDIKASIKRAVKKLYGIELKDIPLEHPKEESHGDYSSNIALVIFSKAKGNLPERPFGWVGRLKAEVGSPMEIASEILKRVQDDIEQGRHSEFISESKVEAPGFINFYLSDDFLIDQLRTVLAQGQSFGGSKEGNGKTALVEYSSPNVAKRFGIGHLRSTIIGQSLYNMYKFLGWETIGENHLGDWGTQFGMLIAALKSEETPGVEESSAVADEEKHRVLESAGKELTIGKLEEMYVDFNRRAQKDPTLMDKARGWFKKLEDGDKEAREIWKAVVDISMSEFDRIYEMLGLKIDNAHGESFYEDKMGEVVEDAKNKGLAETSDGALVIQVPKFDVPVMLLKSDGATTYEARDLAAIKWRMGKWSPDLIIYEVGADQAFHFQRVFTVAEMLGYAKRDQLVHVKHGFYRLPEGKMRTRFGKTIKLEDILNEAIERAKKLSSAKEKPRKGKLRELTEEFPELGNSGVEELADTARAVGIGAIKYFDLSHNPSTDILFDWEKMFVLEGNSAPYLQYTYARAKSVLRKAESAKEKTPGVGESSAVADEEEHRVLEELADWRLNDEELAVLRTIYKFPEVVREAAYGYSPNLLCSYLFDLASKFNTFYNKHSILGKDTRRVPGHPTGVGAGRLALTAAVAQIIQNGLNLLGIETPERM